MTQRRNSKSHGRKEVKSALSKNGRRPSDSAPSDPGRSWFSLVLVLALIGLWSSMAVVYFDVVDYDSVLGKLSAYDSDGDGDFDLEDAKVLLGLKSREREEEEDTPPAPTRTESKSAKSTQTDQPEQSHDPQSQGEEPEQIQGEEPEQIKREEPAPISETDVESDIQDPVPLPGDTFVPDDPREDFFSSRVEKEEKAVPIDTTGDLVKEASPQETIVTSDGDVSGSELAREKGRSENAAEAESAAESATPSANAADAAAEKLPEKDKAKKKKPKLFNKFDKTIKAEIDAAEKLRKKGKVDEALQAFENLVQKYPQSPRARYGKAQAEDDVAEKRRSNDMLQRAINTYREVSELPDPTPDLLKGALKRRAERQQFLGRTRGSLLTLEKLVQMFPDDVSLKNDLGVAHLLLGDNTGAKAVYEQVLAVAPDDGFAKVHYGFILKSENKISESIPYLQGGLESGEPGTDDGRFYFHLGDALQRVGAPDEAHRWYERGQQRGHFSSVWQRSLYNVDGLTARPWWTASETGYSDLVKTLERSWRLIRDEALTVMDQKSGLFLPEEENLRETGEWGQYTLWQQGRRASAACQSVPQTCALMERFPEATGCKRGQIKFSVMQPGTHVWPHTGPTNCRLRLHLGLVVPDTGCRIRCTDSTRRWEEGKVLIFDDSFEHEVWQEAESFRLILIVDVWHPELTAYQRQTLSPI